MSITLIEIRSKSRKVHGIVHPGAAEKGANAEIEPGVFIRLFGTRYPGTPNAHAYARTFKLGDLAEHDSYNLSYYGRIVAITEKSISIEDGRGNRPSLRRLDVHAFNWRNWNFDRTQAANRNFDVLQTC